MNMLIYALCEKCNQLNNVVSSIFTLSTFMGRGVVLVKTWADLLARPAFFICNGANNAHFGSLLIPCEIELADMKDQT